ncbi:prolyl aminopeptidase [Brevundimonas sp. 2R-24]|uniref:Proline iminopeptidase n=1 Tax=Peiella sedimenti TaxID=3061083 RepID=A0ABT8SLT2_9CAUL|nr:prolyl aminopeptidase [Caulobacteraceae bacterium XZ-24]
MTHTARRELYPEIEPFETAFLDTGGIHRVHYEQVGNPAGKPAVVLHGGPGGGINPALRRYFDPALWRVVLPDQRGCGKSTPNAVLEDNDTWKLIEDLEAIRERLGFERWTVFGGSWGSTLAMAYAITHPERVEALVLRGIFLMAPSELHWFYQDGASHIFPDAWEGFLAPIPEAERGQLMEAYWRRLSSDDPAVRTEAAIAWASWEGDTVSVKGPQGRPEKFAEPEFAVAFARIENHYFRNLGFFPESDWILKNVDRMRRIPTWIVQGRFDVVTPCTSAWSLHRAWPEANFEMVPDAGHASSEPGIIDGLVRATDAAARL